MRGTLLHPAAGLAGILVEHMRVETNQCYAGMYGSASAAQAIQSTPDQASAEGTVAGDETKTAAKAEAKPKKKKK